MGILFFHALVTFILTGLIWTIQMVHYPLFAFLNDEQVPEAMAFHQKHISFLVVPLMLFEIFSGVGLAIAQWHTLAYFHGLNLMLLAIIWIHTFSLMLPFHQRMSNIKDLGLLKTTLRHHWIRTIAWTIKSVLWGGVLWHLMPT